MKILVHKDFRKKYSKSKYDKICDAIEFYTKKFNFDHYDVRLEVICDIGILQPGTSGTAHFEPHRKTYVINIRPQFMKDLLDTIFHELTHIHQAMRGDLRHGTHHDFWKGAPYPVLTFTHRVQDFKSWFKLYENLPWEVEAREVAKNTLIEFNKSRKAKFWSKLKFWSK